MTINIINNNIQISVMILICLHVCIIILAFTTIAYYNILYFSLSQLKLVNNL